MKCDLCEREATEFDSWFGTASCNTHKHVSPVERQKLLAAVSADQKVSTIK